jgi:cyclohexadieny/prephenate dehydrogenase
VGFEPPKPPRQFLYNPFVVPQALRNLASMKLRTLTIVGVGLIGGSIGLAAKSRGLAGRVVGAGRSQASLDRARARGAIDEGHVDLASAVRDAELAVFCTPVDRIAAQVLEAAAHCSPGTLLCDAGSTKALIVKEIEARLRPDVHFVGCHPLAGSEKRGPEHADARLFENRLTVITPTPQTDPAALEKIKGFWQALGSRIRIMAPEEHDRALALTSHLPHLVAAGLAGILPPELGELTATGFWDTTRVAAGEPSLWTAIFAQNRTEILRALLPFEQRLAEFRRVLDSADWGALDSLLAQAKKVRDALGS